MFYSWGVCGRSSLCAAWAAADDSRPHRSRLGWWLLGDTCAFPDFSSVHWRSQWVGWPGHSLLSLVGAVDIKKEGLGLVLGFIPGWHWTWKPARLAKNICCFLFLASRGQVNTGMQKDEWRKRWTWDIGSSCAFAISCVALGKSFNPFGHSFVICKTKERMSWPTCKSDQNRCGDCFAIALY